MDQFVFYGEPFQGVPSVDDMRIYSLSPRAFAKENALQVIRTRLDSIQMLNVNVIWILPIFLKSETRVPYGSPYSMRDFYKIDPEYNVPYSFYAATRKDAYLSTAARKLLEFLDEIKETF